MFTSLPRSVADDVQLVLGSPFIVDRFVSFDRLAATISIAGAVDNHLAADHRPTTDRHAAEGDHHTSTDHQHHPAVNHGTPETDHHTTADISATAADGDVNGHE